jgi:hypothetical protein
MDEQRVAEFIARYQGMEKWEIAELHARASSLTEEARTALDAVISGKNIDIEDIRQKEEEENSLCAEKERVLAEKKKRRDARLFKAFLVVGTPLIVLQALLRPESAYETFVSTLVQVVGVSIAAWVMFAIKRALNKKNLNCTDGRSEL